MMPCPQGPSGSVGLKQLSAGSGDAPAVVDLAGADDSDGATATPSAEVRRVTDVYTDRPCLLSERSCMPSEGLKPGHWQSPVPL